MDFFASSQFVFITEKYGNEMEMTFNCKSTVTTFFAYQTVGWSFSPS